MAVQLPFLTSNNFSGLLNERFWQNAWPVPARNSLNRGDAVPDGELPAVGLANPVRLSAVWQEQPLLLVFTRIFTEHQYCPLCYPHLKELNENYEAFQSKGVAVLVVTSTDLQQSEKVAADLGLKMPLLVDPQCTLFRKYRTGQALGAPLPAQFLIDQQGRLCYKHLFSFFEANAPISRLLQAVDALPVSV
ncbi:peroxiredoxin family protein [Thermosynechococcaceae cyanobacterium Okahandja]